MSKFFDDTLLEAVTIEKENGNLDSCCEAYDKETGICKEFCKYCDGCYSHYMNMQLDKL